MLAALLPEAQFEQHDVPESGGVLQHAQLFASHGQVSTWHEVYVHCFDTHLHHRIAFGGKCLFLVNPPGLRQE